MAKQLIESVLKYMGQTTTSGTINEAILDSGKDYTIKGERIDNVDDYKDLFNDINDKGRDIVLDNSILIGTKSVLKLDKVKNITFKGGSVSYFNVVGSTLNKFEVSDTNFGYDVYLDSFKIKDLKIKNAEMSDVYLNGVTIAKGSFANTRLPGEFRSSVIKNTDIKKSTIGNTFFKDVTASNVKIVDSDLTLFIQGGKYDNILFKNIRKGALLVENGTVIKNGVFENLDYFKFTFGRNIKFINCEFKKCDFAWLDGITRNNTVEFKNVKFTKCNFSNPVEVNWLIEQGATVDGLNENSRGYERTTKDSKDLQVKIEKDL